MDKVWLKHYPSGVSETIDADRFTSLSDFLAVQCDKYSDLVAFENFDAQITFKEFDERSKHFAAYLQNELGLKKGDRFAIMLPNIIQFPIVMYAAIRAGLVVVNVNPLYTVRELSHQLKDSGAKAIIVMENFAHTLSEALPMAEVKHVVVTKMGDCLSLVKGSMINWYLKFIKRQIPDWSIPGAINYLQIMRRGSSHAFKPVDLTGEDLAFLQYTGGTTGLAKGAMLTHRNIVANILQCLEWVQAKLQDGKDTVITALPLYHIFSLTGCFFFMAVGSKALLITNPRDIKRFVKILITHKFSLFVGLNTLFNGLMHQPNFKKIDFSELNLVISGGMALQKPVADRWYQQAGSVIIEGYGLTEASPVVAINPLTNTAFTGSVGMPVPSTEVQIRDKEKNELAMGGEGELWVRGPQVMRGYWKRLEATRDVIDADGWLRTGDIARLGDDGAIYIVDREKDMIIVSGFNVYPNEIEEVIMSNPGVKEVAVIGVPSDRTGESVKAFIVRTDKHLQEEDIVAFCLKRLTKYKIPKTIEFRHELPKSNVGKVLRRALRE